MKIKVRTLGEVRPTRPVTPLEIAQAMFGFVGKETEVEIDPSALVSELADRVDTALGINPVDTFDEILMEYDQVLDKNRSLGEQGVSDGDLISYRFILMLH